MGQQWPQEKQRTRLLVEFFVEGGIGFADSLVEDCAEGGHGGLWEYFSALGAGVGLGSALGLDLSESAAYV